MKKFSLYIAIIASAITLVSCKSSSSLQKDIKHMKIHFKPLSRADMVLMGNLETQTTITGKMKQGKKMLDKSFAANLKTGTFRYAATEMLYFTPGANEVITGSLYDNEIWNTVYGSTSVAAPKGIFRRIMDVLIGGKKIYLKGGPPQDVALNFAYYALIEKYPDVDYFINVRFDRKSIVTGGGKFTETVIVKADGVKLKTD